jgi:hypothetical protein
LHIDTIVYAKQQRQKKTSAQAERNDKDYGKRYEQTFIETTKYNVDEYNAYGQYYNGGIAFR